MKAASLKDIKTELDLLHPSRLKELCVHVAKFKKENKELLSYLLFDASDEEAYIRSVKEELDELFQGINKSKLYEAKKGIRKIITLLNKQIKYSGSKRTEVELRIYFCKRMRKTGVPLTASTLMGKVYMRQFLNAQKALSTLHEDLQADFEDELRML